MAISNDKAQSIVDSYSKSVQEQKDYAAAYEQNVRQVLVPKDEEAEKTMQKSYNNLKYATGVFDVASSDKLTLKQQREQIIQERDWRIAQAREKALKEGKSSHDIKLLIDGISAEYADRLVNLDFNISRADTTTFLKQKTLAEAKSVYQSDRFSQIGTSNDVYSGFLQASMLWSDVGRMQRHQAFLQSVADGGQSRHLDFNG